MYDLQESVERLNDYLEKILPGVDGEIDIDMSELEDSYYWNFDYEKRSYQLTFNKESGDILGESWRLGTKVQYKKL
ncbi:MAG: hypothetical protein KAH04_05205 [Psychrilyobacter sp.]|nr:hypothetical protein [Psychrilyobacter sp.]